jgi:hypothetical protein
MISRGMYGIGPVVLRERILSAMGFYQQPYHNSGLILDPSELYDNLTAADPSMSHPKSVLCQQTGYQTACQQYLDTGGSTNMHMNDHPMLFCSDQRNHYPSISQTKFEPCDRLQSPFADSHQTLSSYTDQNQPQNSEHIGSGEMEKEMPYAQLIHKALLAAPNHTMVLRDIYEWFKLHTDKANGSDTKGWQNSIRHNLSMNGVSH